MGFCTKINPYTNREVLCCDFCMKSVGDSGIKFVKKKRCPFEYCQAYATCNNCWKQNNKEMHQKSKCDVYAREYDERQAEKQRILNEGHYIVISALSHDNLGVKVIFQNKEKQEKAFWVPEGMYPIKDYRKGYITTLEEYQETFKQREGLILEECQNIDIYSPN